MQAIADGFILVHQTEKYKRGYEKAISPFARDTTGLLAGCVTDYALDEKTLDVLAAEIMPGYWPAENRRRIWTFSYRNAQEANGDLIIPVLPGSGLIFSREGI